MKWNRFIATAALLSGPYCFAQAPMADTEKPANQNPLFSIAVAPSDEHIKAGSPILVTVTVTNISGKNAAWPLGRGQNGPFKEFRYLLMKDGHETEMTVFHRKIVGRQRSDNAQELEAGSTIGSVPPGVVRIFTRDLNCLYEIKEPGVYTLEVSLFDEASKKTIVHSNNLTLEIRVAEGTRKPRPIRVA